MINNVSVFVEGTRTKEAFAEYILRMYCDEAIPADVVNAIKLFYKNNYHDYYIDKIKNNDKKAYEYYIDLLTLCILNKLCFKNFLDVLIEADIEHFEGMLMEIDKDSRAKEIKEAFIKVIDGPLAISGMQTNDAVSILEEMIKNSIGEVNRLLNKYLPRLKKPFENLNITPEDEEFIMLNEISLNFTNKKVFAQIINNSHGLAPLTKKGDTIFFTENEKIIHLPFTRGLFIGYIKKLIINSSEITKVLPDLRNSAKYLRISNYDGELDIKIDDIESIVKFIEWGLEHKRVIEYHELARHMSIQEDDMKKFSAKLSNNNGKSFKKNIAKLLSSNSEDIQIERFVEISGYDSVIVHDWEC